MTNLPKNCVFVIRPQNPLGNQQTLQPNRVQISRNILQFRQRRKFGLIPERLPRGNHGGFRQQPHALSDLYGDPPVVEGHVYVVVLVEERGAHEFVRVREFLRGIRDFFGEKAEYARGAFQAGGLKGVVAVPGFRVVVRAAH